MEDLHGTRLPEASREADIFLREHLLEECLSGDKIMCILWPEEMNKKMKQKESLASREKHIASDICTMDAAPNPYTIFGGTFSQLCDLTKLH